MYHACTNIPYPPVLDDDDMGGNDVWYRYENYGDVVEIDAILVTYFRLWDTCRKMIYFCSVLSLVNILNH